MEISDSERNELSEEEMCLALKGEESMEESMEEHFYAGSRLMHTCPWKVDLSITHQTPL